jgi:hypothetical protein
LFRVSICRHRLGLNLLSAFLSIICFSSYSTTVFAHHAQGVLYPPVSFSRSFPSSHHSLVLSRFSFSQSVHLSTLHKTVTTIFATYPDDTRIITGHGEETTIGEGKATIDLAALLAMAQEREKA